VNCLSNDGQDLSPPWTRPRSCPSRRACRTWWPWRRRWLAPRPHPPTPCCVAFLRAVSLSAAGGGEEGCLCHLLRNPLLLGFPIDAASLAALLPAWAAGNAFAAATLFADACRGEGVTPPRAFLPSRTMIEESSALLRQVPVHVLVAMLLSLRAFVVYNRIWRTSSSCG